MSKKVYHLKRATPKMKYQHMKNVLEFREDLKEHQAQYKNPVCPKCDPNGERVKASLPFYLVGKTNLCYSCYEEMLEDGKRQEVYAEIDKVMGPDPIRQTDYDDIAEYFLSLEKEDE